MSAQTRVVDILVGLQIADILDEQQRTQIRLASSRGAGMEPFPRGRDSGDSYQRSA